MFKVLFDEKYYTVYHIDNVTDIKFIRFLIYKDNEWIYIKANDCIPKDF